MLKDALPSGWESVMLTLIVGVPAYIALIMIYRLPGKRSFADMNTFDLIVVVSHALIFGTMLLSESFALADGITALALLLFVQLGGAWLSLRLTPKHESERSEQPLLYCPNGALVDKSMRPRHVSRDKVIEPMVATAFFRNRKRALRRCNLASLQSNRNLGCQSKKRYSRGEIIRN